MPGAASMASVGGDAPNARRRNFAVMLADAAVFMSQAQVCEIESATMPCAPPGPSPLVGEGRVGECSNAAVLLKYDATATVLRLLRAVARVPPPGGAGAPPASPTRGEVTPFAEDGEGTRHHRTATFAQPASISAFLAAAAFWTSSGLDLRRGRQLVGDAVGQLDARHRRAHEALREDALAHLGHDEVEPQLAGVRVRARS